MRCALDGKTESDGADQTMHAGGRKKGRGFQWTGKGHDVQRPASMKDFAHGLHLIQECIAYSASCTRVFATCITIFGASADALGYWHQVVAVQARGLLQHRSRPAQSQSA